MWNLFLSKMDKLIKFLFLLFLVPLASGAAEDKTAPQRAVAILDYIAGDYQMAVAPEGGKILSDMEYREMADFVDLVRLLSGPSSGTTLAGGGDEV